MKISKKDYDDLNGAIHSLRESVVSASFPSFCPRCGSNDLDTMRQESGDPEEMYEGSKVKEQDIVFFTMCGNCGWSGDICPGDTKYLPGPVKKQQC